MSEVPMEIHDKLVAIEGLTKEHCLLFFARKGNLERIAVASEFSAEVVRKRAIAFLNTVEKGLTLGTIDVVKAIAPDVEDTKAINSISGKLTCFAPGSDGLATHDGEKFVYFGKPARRWRWHGQKGTENE